MPVAFTEKPAPYETMPNRIRWTCRQCEAMRESGFLTGHYELIDGEILSKMGQKPAYAYVLSAVLTWLAGLFGAETVRMQSTLDISETSPEYDEPEPDAAVTRQSYQQYTDRHPDAQDVLLLIEVSDTTLRFDLNTKAALYARAGITDYWVIDITGRRLIVHRQPAPQGYQNITAFDSEEEVTALSCPDMPVRVAALLPPTG